MPAMGKRFSRHKKKKKSKEIASQAFSVMELLAIKDHPDRNRRRSSIAPTQPAIKEEAVLEDLCTNTNREPDKPVDELEKSEVQQIVKRLSLSKKIASLGSPTRKSALVTPTTSPKTSCIDCSEDSSKKTDYSLPFTSDAMDEMIKKIQRHNGEKKLEDNERFAT